MSKKVNCTVHEDGEYWIWKNSHSISNFPYWVRRGNTNIDVSMTLWGAKYIIWRDKRHPYNTGTRPDRNIKCSEVICHDSC